MKHWLILSVFTCVIYLSNTALASGASHWYTIDLFQHLLWNETCVHTAAVPVPSANTKSTAYFLQGKDRCLEVDSDFLHKTVKQVMEDAGELTILTAFKQHPHNIGSIMSIFSNSQRYFELENSGRRNELRIHYIHKQRAVTEVFPHQLADNQWHSIALSFTDSFLQLFIDCEKAFERRIPKMDFSFLQRDNIQLWLGQRNEKHGFFKGSIEYVKLLNSPQGYLTQCPYADVACPTCSEYTSLQNTVTELYSMVQTLHSKLETQEERLGQLEECECRRHCDVDGIRYRDGESWKKEQCTTCTCREGKVTCSEPKCKSVSCKNPVLMDGECCPVCLKHCYHNGRHYDHGESFTSSGHKCLRCKCQDGQLSCKNAEMDCPTLSCPVQERVSVEGQCCKVCADSLGRYIPEEVDYCGQGHNCHPNATCVSLSNRYTCKCKDGFLGNDKYCRDIDECDEENGDRSHHCSAHSRCVNTLGSYTCQCDRGYIKLDPYTCREHNECDSGAHTCSSQAECENSEGGYACHCLPGYEGDGFSCTPVCPGGCENGGLCIGPGTCQCRKGFYGSQCQIDIDECRLGVARCHPNSLCINIPGDYLCECRPGYQSIVEDNKNGWLCKDLDECSGYGGGHKCSDDTVCQNTEGSYQCVCTDPSQCRADCYVHGEPVPHGSLWPSVDDVCAECRCKNGHVDCHPLVCDCNSRGVDFRCCPQCLPEKRCTHQELPLTYHSGDSWTYKCQTCQCIDGETDCWRLECPALSCSPTIRLPGDCCPRCGQESDPCLADVDKSALRDVSQGVCEFGGNVYRSGEDWRVTSLDRCTQCTCKDGHVCCSHNSSCLQDTRYGRRHLHRQPSMADFSYDDLVEMNDNNKKNKNKVLTKTQQNDNNNGQGNVVADSNSKNVHDTGQDKELAKEDDKPNVDLQRMGQQGLSRNLHLNKHGSRGNSNNNRRKDSRRRSNHRRYRGSGNIKRSWRSNEDLTYSLRGQG